MVASPARTEALSADESAALLTQKIRAEEPFFFARFGDGFLECVSGKPGRTCDGEEYSLPLACQMMRCWVALLGAPNVYLGDWLAASFDADMLHTQYADQLEALVGKVQGVQWLHPEALLLMRESRALVDFYRAVREDKRRKLFIGPGKCAGAAEMLGAEHLVTPLYGLFAEVDRLTEALLSRQFDVVVFGAGMAGMIPVVRCWERHPDRTYVHLGSAMDPLFRGKTRRQQLSQYRARMLFSDLLS